MKRVLVTGAAGFTGRHFLEVAALQQPDIHFLGLSRQESAKLGAFEAVQADLFETGELADALGKAAPEGIIHFAGATAPASRSELWAANVGLTTSLLLAASRALRGCRVVVIGSAAEYRSSSAQQVNEDMPVGGEGDYGLSKFAQTSAALAMSRELGLDVVIARPFNLLGPGMGDKFVAGKICRQVQDVRQGKQPRLTIGRTSGVRDFIDVRDASRAILSLLLEPGAEGVFNVCTGVGTSVEDLLQLFLAEAGLDDSVVLRESQERNSDVDRMVGDSNRLRAATGWQPELSLERTVRDMLEA